MQSVTATWFVGVDVGKDNCTVAVGAGSSYRIRQLPNQRAALGRWLAGVPADSALALESTGRYHETLVELAFARGLAVYLLNPRVLHHYAKAIHHGVKTDRYDAELIARFLAHRIDKLRPYRPPSALECELLTLQRRRAKLVTIAVRLRQSLGDLPDLAERLQQLLHGIHNTITDIDQRCAALLASDTSRQDLARRLRSLPGFGPLTSTHHAAFLPRVDPHNADQLVAFTGLALTARDSGKHHGQRRLSKAGSSETRRLLFLAAATAVRHRPEWQALYENLLSRGRARIEALTILARRLLRIAYAIYRHGGTYDPTRVPTPAGLST